MTMMLGVLRGVCSAIMIVGIIMGIRTKPSQVMGNGIN